MLLSHLFGNVLLALNSKLVSIFKNILALVFDILHCVQLLNYYVLIFGGGFDPPEYR